MAGSSKEVPITVAELESLMHRMTHELSETVKAVVESSRGRFGTVGAMAVDDFIQKLKLAMSQLVGPVSTTGTSLEQCVTSVPPVYLGLSSSPVVGSGLVSGSMSQLSALRSNCFTAFGGERSIRSKDSGKPGKNSQKDHGRGFSTNT